MSTSPQPPRLPTLPPPWPALATVVAALRTGPRLADDAAAALDLADAVLRDLAATRADPPPGPQVAVIGPTQAGKSTVVNLLLGRSAAGVSPLAGFTVHAEAFTEDAEQAVQPWLGAMFAHARRAPREALERERYDQYAVTVLDPGAAAALPSRAVVWDTPDFDSLAAERYRRGVLDVIALADVVVLVVSREKYADLAVWRLLELIAPLRRRLIVCLNKSTPEAGPVIVAALEARLAQAGLAPAAVLEVALDAAIAAGQAGAGAGALRAAVGEAARAAVRPRPADGARALLGAWWQAWTAPERARHRALEEWTQRVDEAVDAALAAYRRDYLEGRRYDAVQRAIVELLVLLEPPALAATLGRARRVLGWPARRLWGIVRAPRGEAADSEMLVLDEALERLLSGLSVHCARAAGAGEPPAAVWGALYQRLGAGEPALRAAFADAAARHREAFAADIQDAAGRLYARLKEHPRLLNAVRAARISADLAGLALALKTGGVGVHDLVFAPAVMSLTTTLTESALGAYMRQITADLRRRQLRAVREQVFDAALRPALAALAAGDRAALVAVDRRSLEAADAAMERIRGD